MGRDSPRASARVASGRLPNEFGAAILERGETIEVWSALDALVLKATSIVIAAHCLPELSMRCYHIEGQSGAKAAVRFIADIAARIRSSFGPM